VVRRLCWLPPEDGDVDGALAAMGARRWQIDLCSPALQIALRATPEPEVTGE
jgi:ribonuclease D